MLFSVSVVAYLIVKDAWSIKKLHKLMMLSATFRQSSKPVRKARWRCAAR